MDTLLRVVGGAPHLDGVAGPGHTAWQVTGPMRIVLREQGAGPAPFRLVATGCDGLSVETGAE